jgi:hypothetical protein
VAGRPTRYGITVVNPEHRCVGVREATLDGAPVDPGAVPIVDDGRTHLVRVVMGGKAGGVARRAANTKPRVGAARDPGATARRFTGEGTRT